ncbi:cupin domain-containing protein [Novosphingobium sp. KACC 22771]|uniref:cupin domain-containing protein n=1 Tax=Novosphingobium sp. KACC 22771 TaxID=3025670 RepID=UPI00236507C8|nr:cupin domain-containing protein [Novosphingobium sp. KACC 22771]WDF72505.1 cupin domain-containing protein [Novosphingobium sp. KACC 22771]
MTHAIVTLTDIGPRPSVFDIERAALENQAYRTVVWSGQHLQVTLMSIPVDADIGLEMHPETDQFLRLESGNGLLRMGAGKDLLTLAQDIADGWCAMVPAGFWHNITNIGDAPMKIYAIYAPAHHAPGKVQLTAADAAADLDDKPAN